MLKIGDFSRICQVSIKALRYWDKVGLLEPAVTDPETGYRYYEIEQIAIVNRILAFRTMGLEREQIRELLQDNPSPDNIRAMLRLKQVELQQQMDEVAARLQIVESRLHQIEHDGNLPEYEVTLKPVESQSVLAFREVLPDLNAMVYALYETHGYARERTGSNMLVVFHDEAYVQSPVDVEIGFPTSETAPIQLSSKRVLAPRMLPSVELMASTVHRGNWHQLSKGYEHLGRWITSSGFKIAGPGREIFHHIDWETNPGSSVTELQFPVSRLN